MPFKSKAQQRFMFSQHPEMAKRWAEHTPDIKSLPEKVDSDSNEKKSFVTAAELGRLTAFAEKRAALDPAVANALGLGGAGAVLGGGIGALSGLISPGYHDSPDEEGILRRRRNSRLFGAFGGGIKGLSGGFSAGALAGGLGTEALRLIPSIAMQQKIENLKSKPTTGILDTLNRNAQIGMAQASKSVYDNLGRDAQHAYMKSQTPQLYSNIFSNAANNLFSRNSEQ